MSDQTREKATLFVGGLDNQVTAQTLHDAFIPFGEIADISLPKPDLWVVDWKIYVVDRLFCLFFSIMLLVPVRWLFIA
jgi:RNA recognition motif-containing protein